MHQDEVMFKKKKVQRILERKNYRKKKHTKRTEGKMAKEAQSLFYPVD